jgi:trk system potassium uptake protein TrkH
MVNSASTLTHASAADGYRERFKPTQFSPVTVLIAGFVVMILIGTLLLALPWAAADRHSIGPIDALFTSTSAVCVTGLIVKNTPVDFSLFGQIVILVLIQLGGFGYAGSAMLLGVALGRKIGLRERLMFQQAMNLLTLGGLVKFLRWLVICTVLIEGSAAALLMLRFAQDLPLWQAGYTALFHAVSAFNNAGFSLFSDNLTRYRFDWSVNLIMAITIILGGIGYIVLYELHRYARREIFRIPSHVKLVAVVTTALILIGGLGLWMLEATNPSTLSGLSWSEQATVVFFHSVAARTAGFNTVGLSLFRGASLYLLILLMIIGGSPASTAGGIKTTTAGIIFATLWDTVKGRQEVTIFHRRLPLITVANAFLLAFLAFALVTGATLLLLAVEQRSFQHFLPVLFEVSSAFGTVGLSTGNGGALSYTATFSDPGKLIIIVMMFVGRLGPITMGMLVVARGEPRVRYPEEKVLIG